MAEMNQETDLLTVDEAARFLHLRPSTVRDWIYKKRIPYVKLSRRVFLLRCDLEALVSRCVVPASCPSGIVADIEVSAEFSLPNRAIPPSHSVRN